MTAHQEWIGLIFVIVYIGQTHSTRSTSPPSGQLTCARCNFTSDMTGCTSEICSAGMICYMDEIVSEQLTIGYTGGCRTRHVCTRGGAIGKRDGALVACTKCCELRDLCNGRLCGIKGYRTTTKSTLQTRGQTHSMRPTSPPSGQLTCARCNFTSDMNGCTSEICSAGMVCYMDEVITEQSTIVYNGGCRPRDVCTRGGAIGKRDGALVACTKCCEVRDLCNGRLCGIKGYRTTTKSTLQTRGQTHSTRPTSPPSGQLTCARCNLTSDMNGCTSEICSAGMVCYMDEVITEQLTIVYNGGCRPRDVCTRGAVGKRDGEHACTKCCDSSDLCNGRLCGIKSYQTTTTSTLQTRATSATTTPGMITSPRRLTDCLGCSNSTTDLPGCSIVKCDAVTQSCYVEVTGGVVHAGCRDKQVCHATTIIGKRHQHAASGNARATSGCSTCCDPSHQCLCNGLHCGLNNFAVLNLMNKAQCFAG